MKATDYTKAKELLNRYSKITTALRHSTPEQAVIIRKIDSRRINKQNTSIKEFCDALIKFRMQKIAYNMPEQGYSMGGEKKIVCGKLWVNYDNCSQYAKSCSFKPTWGFYSERITFEELRGIQIIGGLVTYIYPNQKGKLKKCWWYVGKGQKQYFQLVRQQGWLYGEYHSTDKATAIREGRRIEETIVRQAKEKAIKQRYINKAMRAQYTFSDSLASGNCEAGTRAFCIRLRLNEQRNYRGTFLLKKAQEKSTNSVPFILRMIEFRARLLFQEAQKR